MATLTRSAILETVCRVRLPEQGRTATTATRDGVVTVEGKRYQVGRSVPAEASQDEVFGEVGQPALDWFWAGYNTALIAYGEPGSGKTYTLFGTEGAVGLGERILGSLFDRIAVDGGRNAWKVGLECWDMVNGLQLDLLQPHFTALPQGRPGATLVTTQVEDIQQATEVLHLARQRSANWDMSSGRASVPNKSHAFVRVVLFQTSLRQGSALILCDLAGSELDKPVYSASKPVSPVVQEENVRLEQLINTMVAFGPGSDHCYQLQQLSALNRYLFPVLTGNCKVFLLGTVAATDHHLPATERTLKTVCAAQGITTVCSRSPPTTWDALCHHPLPLRVSEATPGGGLNASISVRDDVDRNPLYPFRSFYTARDASQLPVQSESRLLFSRRAARNTSQYHQPSEGERLSPSQMTRDDLHHLFTRREVPRAPQHPEPFVPSPVLPTTPATPTYPKPEVSGADQLFADEDAEPERDDRTTLDLELVKQQLAERDLALSGWEQQARERRDKVHRLKQGGTMRGDMSVASRRADQTLVPSESSFSSLQSPAAGALSQYPLDGDLDSVLSPALNLDEISTDAGVQDTASVTFSGQGDAEVLAVMDDIQTADFKGKIDFFVRQNEALKSQQHRMDRHLIGLSRENARLKQGRLAENEQIKSLQAALDRANAQIESLSQRLAEGQTSADEDREQRRLLERDLGLAQAKTSNLKTGVRETQDTLQMLEAEVKALRNKNEYLVGKLERARGDSEARNQRTDRLIEIISDLHATLGRAHTHATNCLNRGFYSSKAKQIHDGVRRVFDDLVAFANEVDHSRSRKKTLSRLKSLAK